MAVKKTIKKAAKKVAKKVTKKVAKVAKKAGSKKTTKKVLANKAGTKTTDKKGFKQSAIAKPAVKKKTQAQQLAEKETATKAKTSSKVESNKVAAAERGTGAKPVGAGSQKKPDLKGNTSSSKRDVAGVKTTSSEQTTQAEDRTKPRTMEKSEKQRMQHTDTENLPDNVQDVQGAKNHGYAGAGMNIDSDSDDHRADLRGTDLAQQQAIESTSNPVKDQDQ